MKTFEEIDVFLPDEESKVHMKDAYNILIRMIEDICEQLRTKTYDYGLLMLDYAPEYMFDIVKPYGLKLYLDNPTNTLYLALVYVHENGNDPICYVNATPEQPGAVDCDCVAYILMVAFINHLGMRWNQVKEAS